MSNGKKIDKSAHIGDAGIALIHMRVSAMGHVWHARGLDAGIDGMIELRDPGTGVVSNCHLLVQSKASDRQFPGETPEKFHFVVDERDLEYWLQATLPVILVCSHPNTNEAWWIHIQHYFADPARRADRRVDFAKATMAFDKNSSDRLFAVADPHGQAHNPVAEHRVEKLVSNLLPVAIPLQYWSYESRAKDTGHAYALQRDSELEVRHDFVVKGGHLLTWAPVEGTALAKATEGCGKVAPAGELMDGGADNERLLVWMLNAALRHDVRDDCVYHRKRRMLYFTATKGLKPRRVNTAGKHLRTVFKGHPKKKDPNKIAYYKHSGLQWQFVNFEGEWFCTLTPAYFYSYDGRKESRFTASYLSGIKKLERNQAVLGETRMWAAFLRFEPDLLDERDRILDFGELEAFDVERGLDDESWRKDLADTGSSDEISLFEHTA
uniref:DUF4365 domain-containing protein n=1 Tax=Mycobacterium sp. (strain KMS) TaxID=189918 RepID=A1UQ25_MYCSK